MSNDSEENTPVHSIQLSGVTAQDTVTYTCGDDELAKMLLPHAVIFAEALPDALEQAAAATWRTVELAESSNVDQAMYHADTARVRVQFKGGAVYDYYGVEPGQMDTWEAAESAGTYLNTVLKNTKVHPCLKVDLN